MSKEPDSAASVYEEAVPYVFNRWSNEHDLPLVRSLAEAFYFTERAKESLDVLLEEMTEVRRRWGLPLLCVCDILVLRLY